MSLPLALVPGYLVTVRKEHFDGATLLWLETPSNPRLDVCDLVELIAAAHLRKTLVAVDNATATVLGQHPLELGVAFSVSSLQQIW